MPTNANFSFLLLFLGSAIFAGLPNNFLFGALIAALSACQVIYSFGAACEHSAKQAKTYLQLYNSEASFHDEELRTKLSEIEDSDHRPWNLLKKAATVRTRIQRHITDYPFPHFTWCEKLVSRMAGDLPSP